jgi:hypothetical protein
MIKDFKKVELGEQSEKLKYLEGKIDLCHKERVPDQQTRQQLEKNMENMNTTRLVSIFNI